MAQTKPAIIGTALTAWEDAFPAIGAMPLVAGTAFAIVILMALASFWIISDAYALAASHWLPVYSIVSGVVQGLLLAPLAIAVHRYVLLGEATPRYPLDPFSARYVRSALPFWSRSCGRCPALSRASCGTRRRIPAPRLCCWVRRTRAVHQRFGGSFCFRPSRSMPQARPGATRGATPRAARGAWPHLVLRGGAGHNPGRLALLGPAERRVGRRQPAVLIAARRDRGDSDAMRLRCGGVAHLSVAGRYPGAAGGLTRLASTERSATRDWAGRLTPNFAAPHTTG